MNAVKFFDVGGSVRDQFLGRQPDDFDFSVEGTVDVDEMAAEIVARGGRFNKDLDKLNAGTRKHFTLKAQWQDKGACDFVMCRVEGPHSDGRHPDWVRPGTVFDDLLRRDFTFNALARGEDGVLIDPFDGQADLANRVVRCVGNSGDADQDAVDKLLADSIRTFRALRFSVQLEAELHSSVRNAFDHPDLPALVASLNDNQKRKELGKLFALDSLRAVRLLNTLPSALQEAVFSSGQLWLKPTTERAA